MKPNIKMSEAFKADLDKLMAKHRPEFSLGDAHAYGLCTVTETEDNVSLSYLVLSDNVSFEIDDEAKDISARFDELARVPLPELVVRGAGQKIHDILDEESDSAIRLKAVHAALVACPEMDKKVREGLAACQAAAEASLEA